MFQIFHTIPTVPDAALTDRIQACVKVLYLLRSTCCGGLMVSALVSGSSGPGSSPGRGHCVVFLGKTLNSHCAPLHPGV